MVKCVVHGVHTKHLLLVLGMVQGVLPVEGSNTKQPYVLDKHMEERRLCYVAYTRAKNRLICSYFRDARCVCIGC